MAGYYNYEELKAKAESGNQDDINALGKWFEQYGERYWNGEFYDVEGECLYPIYEEELDDELIQASIVGYEFR